MEEIKHDDLVGVVGHLSQWKRVTREVVKQQCNNAIEVDH